MSRQVSIDTVLAVFGWVAGLVLIGFGFWADEEWGSVGLAAVAGGCVFIVRRIMNGQNARERAAFELGRATREDDVRRLR